MGLIIAVSLFMIGVTLAFSLIILDNTRIVEEIFDVIFVIDGIIKFFTAYYQDVKLITSRFRIFRRYLLTFMMFDIISTLPSLFSFQNEDIYFLKIFRVVRILHVIWPIYAVIDLLVTDKMLIRRLKEATRLTILFSVIHVLACCWIYIGRKQDGSWIDEPNDYEDFSNNYNIYIAAVYWVVTTLTTVGYGDIKGFTVNEYLFQIGVEFIGIGVFALFMSAVNNNLGTTTDIVEDKIEDLDWWLYKLDTTRGEEKIPGPLYYSIKRFVETSLKEDFNMIIEDFDFYYKLKPSLRYELVDELFGEFVQRFNILFINPKEGMYQEKGFTADFAVNLYCRVYIPGQDIVKYQEDFEEMYLIREGGISVLHVEEFGKKDSQKRYMEIIELPPNSFFGEYQIVLRLKSMFIYKSNDGEDTSTMCIRKGILLQLLEEYPKIKDYWEAQGIERRIEFRRLSMIAKYVLNKEHANDINVEEDDEMFDSIPVKCLKDYEDYTAEMDYSDQLLGEIEKDELIPDKSQRVKANATKKAQQGLEVIENEIDIFNEILESHQDQFEQNLEKLSDYVKASRRSPSTNLPVPEMLLSENSPSDVLRNFVQQNQR